MDEKQFNDYVKTCKERSYISPDIDVASSTNGFPIIIRNPFVYLVVTKNLIFPFQPSRFLFHVH